MFQQPQESTAGDKVPMAEIVGSLVLVYVKEHREGIVTTYGPKEAVACDWHVLMGNRAGESFEDALIFQGALIGALKGAAGGEPVLGRIGKGTAKPGQNPPYILQPYNQTDAAVATAWITARVTAVQQPAAPANPPAAAAPAAAATPSQATPAATSASASTPGGLSAEQFNGLPPEVQALLKEQAGIPA